MSTQGSDTAATAIKPFNGSPIHTARRGYLEMKTLTEKQRAHLVQWFDWFRKDCPKDPAIEALVAMGGDFYATYTRVRVELHQTPAVDVETLSKLLAALTKASDGLLTCRRAIGLAVGTKGKGKRGGGGVKFSPPRGPRPSEIRRSDCSDSDGLA